MSTEPIQNPGISPVKPPEPVTDLEGASGGPAGEAPGQFSLKETKGTNTKTSSSPTPMEVSNASMQVSQLGVPTQETLRTQATGLATVLHNLLAGAGALHRQYPQADLNQATAQLVSNHSQRSLQAINYISDQLGVAPVEPAKSSSHIESLLNVLGGGEQQLATISNALAAPGASNLGPAAMLAMQIKMNSVSLQLQFFSTLIGSGVSGIQKIMNIQM